MSAKTLATLALAAILTVPAILVASPMASAEDVPQAPGIAWQPVVAFTQRFWLVYGDLPNGQPDCNSDGALSTSQPATSPTDPRAPCSYNTEIGDLGGIGEAPSVTSTPTFKTGTLVREFNVTGQTLVARIAGSFSAGQVVQVSAFAGGTPLTVSRTIGSSDTSGFTISFGPTGESTRYAFLKGSPLTVTVSVTPATTDQEIVDPTTTQWALDDRNSYLSVTSDDMYRAATWTGDQNTTVRSSFRPLDNNTTANFPLLKGFFALQSAFGQGDINGVSPTFTVLRNNTAYIPFPGAVNRVNGRVIDALSSSDQGFLVWGFPANSIDYRGWKPGEFELQTIASIRGGTLTRGLTHEFAITSVGVLLTAYDDDPDVAPSPVENVAHVTAAGRTTTYVLLAANTGSAADTFQITAQLVSGAGWSAILGGPGVSGDRVNLEAGEQKIVTVTVTAPFASTGAGTFLVTARSVTDPAANSLPITLVTSIGSVASGELGVIAPGRELNVDPGKDTEVTIYLWNRGSAPANLTLQIKSPNQNGWLNTLLAGGQPVQQFTAPNVAPGAITPVTLRIHGPDSSSSTSFDLTLNATNDDVAGHELDKTIKLRLNTLGGYAIEVLDVLGAQQHVVELSGAGAPDEEPAPGDGTLPPLPGGGAPDPSPPGQEAANDDGVDATLTRVWIRNTGHVVEDVRVSLRVVDYARASCTTSAFPQAAGPGLKLVTRSANGATPDFDGTIRGLGPGNATELYVLTNVTRGATPCVDSDTATDFVKFLVTATGARTNAVAAKDVTLVAEDTGGRNAVLIEPVRRLDAATPPQVDLANAKRPSVTKGVKVGEFAQYFLRVTNGASWSDYTADGKSFAPTVTVRAIGVDREHGWNVSMRAVNGQTDQLLNPYNATFTFGNMNTAENRREAWTDREIEVRVYAPDGKNFTGLAGEQNQITLQASLGEATSEIILRTVIAEFPIVNLSAVSGTTIQAHQNEAGAGLLAIYNNGSAPTSVTLTAAMDRDSTANPEQWRVEPSAQSFPVGAFRNRTVAFSVTPPAGVSGGVLRVTAKYVEDSASGTMRTVEQAFTVQVIPGQALLAIDAPVRVATTAPGQPAQFSLNITNRGTGGASVSYALSATRIPNWTITLPSGASSIGPGQTIANVPIVLQAPTDVFNGTSFQTIIRVQDQDNSDDFAVLPVTVNILGGSPVPSLSAPVFQKPVDRGQTQTFEVLLRNLGTAAGTLPVAVRTDQPGWGAAVRDAAGNTVTSVAVGPNELVTLNVTVSAPLALPENSAASFEVTATTPDLTQVARANVRAFVHDYGVQGSLPLSSVDVIPGIAAEYVLRITNTGNDNDTINVSAILPATEFPEWTATITPDRVFLTPGQTAEVRAAIRAPTSPPASPRAYGFQFYVGTVGGAAVNVTKNATVAATAVVPNYRALDVDGDGAVELAVDADKTTANGFEQFREISADGFQCVVVSNSRLSNTARFFLDCPNDAKSLDGIADVWFDPDSVYAYKITQTPDVNGDGTPDYLLDTDRDGKIETAYDSVTERYWEAIEVHALGDDTTQYVVDTNADGRPDYYVDVAGKIATRTQTVPGQPAHVVGLDTGNDGSVDKYYDTSSKEVRGVTAANLSDFASQNWYFIVGFVAFAIVAVALLVVRARGRKPKDP